MELSKQERVLLAGQYRILERLASGERFGAAAEILEHGFKPLYSKIGDQVDESELSEDECRLVLDVLGLYRAIEAYKDSNPGDKPIRQHPWGSFRGFDGNKESECLAFARFLLRDRFEESARHAGATDNFDSHAPTLSKYRNMVTVWKAQGAGAVLSKEAVLQILGPVSTVDARSRTVEGGKGGGVVSVLRATAMKVFDFLTGGGAPIPVPAAKSETAKPAPEPQAAGAPESSSVTAVPKAGAKPEPASAVPKIAAKPGAPAPNSRAKPEAPVPKPVPRARSGARSKAASAKAGVRTEGEKPVPEAAPGRVSRAAEAGKPAAAKPKPGRPARRSKPKPS